MSPKRLRLFSNEGELGPPVEQWLSEQDYDVYHEVNAPGGRADLVGLRTPLVCAVELKLSMTITVLAQARNWLQYTNVCWVAVPAVHRDHEARGVLIDYAAWKGIGILTVGHGYGDGMSVREELEPKFRRRILSALRDHCKPEHKEYAKAGASRGGHYTPFKGTCDRLRRYVTQHPGATMKEILSEVETHYASGASAHANLVAMIEKGVITGVRLERDAKQWRVYPTEGARP